MSLAEAKYGLYKALQNKGCELTVPEIDLFLILGKDENVMRHIINTGPRAGQPAQPIPMTTNIYSGIYQPKVDKNILNNT